MGLAAYYMLRPDCAVTPADPECNGDLPPKAYEVPAVIQDRTFTESGDLLYPPRIVGGGFFGDKVLVNGKVWPYLDVNQGKYRFRLLNGSQAREYTLRLENTADPGQVIPFTLIGTDGGLISAPKDMNTIHMVPAERFDVVIDFAGFPENTEIVLRNDEASPPRLQNIMKFVVQGQAGHITPLPATLKPVAPIPESESAGNRYFNFVNVSEQCAGGEWIIQTLDGPDPATATVLGEHWDDIDAFPVLGTTEVWEFINESNMMHPMHVHLVQFQILDRCPVGGGTCETLAPHEDGTWKDTVRVPPGTRVRVIMRFENYPGKFPAHCHLLDHEDHEMMRQFQTTWDPALAGEPDDVCGPREDCISSLDCGTVSGNLCGNKLCEIGDGEDFLTCPEDCNGRDKGKKRFNCGSDDPNDPGYNCGFAADGYTVLDDRCITNDYFCRVAPRVAACCGDRLCEGQETETSCAIDCAPPPPACEPTGVSETVCNGVDDDCDDLIDEDYLTTPTTCGIGVCDGNTGQLECQNGTEVDTCEPLAGAETEGPPGDATCGDGLDNNCDGLSDGEDPVCQQAIACSQYSNRTDCRNAPNGTCKWNNKQGVCEPR